ncbi:MAG: hypothetical protein QOC85_1547 [Streptomyces sp.]|nr:hypothetical protein [Streptomyces sp.]
MTARTAHTGRTARSARSARTARTRLFAATTVALAALALTACENGQGVRDEGPSAASKSSAQPSGSASASATASPTAKPAGNGAPSTSRTTPGGPTAGATGGSKGGTATASPDRATEGTGTRHAACNGSNTRTAATEVTRPLNHILLTVTNTGSKVCDLVGYPAVRFDEAQAVPPVAEETRPQAVVTLSPGESGYAGVLLAAGDGSGTYGYTARHLEVFFDSGRSAKPALPAKGVYVDEHLTVTYWQSSLADALTY